MRAEVRTVYGHLGWVNCAAFFSDGRRVFTASGGIRIGEELKEDATRTEWTGTEAVTGGIIKEDVDRSMRIWDVHTGQMVRHLAGLTIIVNCLALSPDGLRILVPKLCTSSHKSGARSKFSGGPAPSAASQSPGSSVQMVNQTVITVAIKLLSEFIGVPLCERHRLEP